MNGHLAWSLLMTSTLNYLKREWKVSDLEEGKKRERRGGEGKNLRRVRMKDEKG